jgi:hypothetical protein
MLFERLMSWLFAVGLVCGVLGALVQLMLYGTLLQSPY